MKSLLVLLEAVVCLLVLTSALPNKLGYVWVKDGEEFPIDMNLLPRIYGGDNATANEFPFIVFLVMYYKTSTPGRYMGSACGGSIVNNDWILTAAHCLVDDNGKNPEFVRVLAGSLDKNQQSGPGVQALRSERLVVHSQYNARFINNDIALIKLQSSLRFDNAVQPVCIPSGQNQYIGQEVTAVGWGDMGPNVEDHGILQKLLLSIMDPQVCRRKGGKNSPNFICAEDHIHNSLHSCQGDSGGPLVMTNNRGQFVQVGLESHGVSSTTGEKWSCGKYFGIASIYTRITTYRTWIQQYIGRFSCSV